MQQTIAKELDAHGGQSRCKGFVDFEMAVGQKDRRKLVDRGGYRRSGAERERESNTVG